MEKDDHGSGTCDGSTVDAEPTAAGEAAPPSAAELVAHSAVGLRGESCYGGDDGSSGSGSSIKSAAALLRLSLAAPISSSDSASRPEVAFLSDTTLSRQAGDSAVSATSGDTASRGATGAAAAGGDAGSDSHGGDGRAASPQRLPRTVRRHKLLQVMPAPLSVFMQPQIDQVRQGPVSP